MIGYGSTFYRVGDFVETDSRLEELEKALGEARLAAQNWQAKCEEANRKLRDANRQLSKLRGDYDAMRKSLSFRLGRALTWLPRRLRRGIKYLRDNGLKYTAKLLLIKIIEKMLPAELMNISKIYINSVLTGYEEYKMILQENKIDSDTKIYLMDYGGSGDTFLCCAYLTSRNVITGQDVFVAPSHLSAKIASYYGFGRVLEISRKASYEIRIMEKFYGKRLLLLMLLYETVFPVYSEVIRYMQGYKNFDFMTLLKIGFEINFGLPYNENNSPLKALPSPANVQDEVAGFFLKYSLQIKKTVIIAPQASTNGIPRTFYQKISDKLMQMGFTVCTNLADAKEPVIPGTIPVCIPHNIMVRFCEQCGFFVGTRSGLCDIIASAIGMEKIIIYPPCKPAQGVSSFEGFFSVNKMGLCDDAYELTFDIEKQESQIEEVVSHICVAQRAMSKSQHQKN